MQRQGSDTPTLQIGRPRYGGAQSTRALRNMTTVFLTCVAIGGFVLAAQVVLGLVGLDSDIELDAPDADLDLDSGDLSHGLDLLSVRALAAAAAVFGAAGLFLDQFLPGWLAAGLAVGPGFLAALVNAWLTRWMLGMQSSGSLRLHGAIGKEARVYLTIPSDGGGPGRIHVALQGRSIELPAITRESVPLPSGSSVTILGLVEGSETVEVVSTARFEKELQNDAR